jgi:formylglycine-generating enzyme required for sulfatase activity
MERKLKSKLKQIRDFLSGSGGDILDIYDDTHKMKKRIRGGAWYYNVGYHCCAYHRWSHPIGRGDHRGFRIVSLKNKK